MALNINTTEKIKDTKHKIVGTHRIPFFPRNDGKSPLSKEPINGKNTKSVSISTFHTISIVNSYSSSRPKEDDQNS